MKLLNLGCGNSYHKQWINIDFISDNQYVTPHNLLEGIPLKDNSVDVVYHSHVLEHFTKNDGAKFMKECHRVLKRGGIIRVAVPDLESIVIEYLKNLRLANEGEKDAEHDYNWIKLELLDQMVRNEPGGEMAKYLHQPILPSEYYIFNRIGSEGKKIRNDYLKIKERKSISSNYQSYKAPKRKKVKNYLKDITREALIALGFINSAPNPEVLKIGNFRLSGEIHQWMYDSYSLKKIVLESGFAEVEVVSAFESRIKNWEEYELDVVGGEIRKPDSLFIEATK